jgi:type IV secretory pathway VirB9-like protein
MRKSILSIVLLVGVSGQSATTLAAKPAGACAKIKWVEGQYYEVNAGVHQYTHVILPEPMQGEPFGGSPELWDVKGENIHLFVKPYNYDNAEGGKTTVTVVSDTNKSYDFVFTRVSPAKATPCVFMTDGPSQQKKQGWARPEDRKVMALEGQVAQLQSQLQQRSVDGEVMALDALSKYRSNIYTGYTWEGSGTFVDVDVIGDVYDDGRFTIIRLAYDHKGVPVIKGRMEGADELIEYDYDADKKIFTIPGLYPELVLVYQGTEVYIKRGQ